MEIIKERLTWIRTLFFTLVAVIVAVSGQVFFSFVSITQNSDTKKEEYTVYYGCFIIIVLLCWIMYLYILRNRLFKKLDQYDRGNNISNNR